ncbi:hypothetical protein BGP75_13085 [Motiliproteus sp. MSK22-1]|nr:hypothetical protein BGP75_13085 [Motiliproteus sp. MSK22-1]
MQDGETQYDLALLNKAVVSFGGAFEAAEILFEERLISSTISINHLTGSSIVLAKSLYEDGQTDLCRTIMQSVRTRIHGRLTDESPNTAFGKYAAECLSILDKTYLKLFSTHQDPVLSTSELSNKTILDESFGQTVH